MKIKILTLAMLCLSSSVFSQVFVKSNATGANDGSSWNNAYTSLASALSFSPQGSEIWVAAGTYKAGGAGGDPATTYFIIDKPLSVYGGFDGTETSFSQRDVAANVTILSGDLNGDDLPNEFTTNRSDNGWHVVFLTEGSEGAKVDGFTIEGGNCKYGNPPMNANELEWFGGGVLAFSSCEILQCTFRQNGGGFGSALFTTDGASVVVEGCFFNENNSQRGALAMGNHIQAEVTSCVFSDNHASVFGGAAAIGNTNATFFDCEFTDNTCTGDAAGGLFVFQNNGSEINGPMVSVLNTTFSGNTAPAGGGFVFNNFGQGSMLIVDGCLFENNTANGITDNFGGGFVVQNIGGDIGVASLDATFLNSTFEGNSANDAGGGLFFCRDFTLNVGMDSCNFVNNTSDNTGGGLQFFSFANGLMHADLNHVLFRQNIADISGAGLALLNGNLSNRPEITLNGCVFEENTTPGLGAGLASFSTSAGVDPGPIVAVENSTFLDNTTEACCGAIWASTSELTVSDSYFEGNSTAADLTGGGAIGLSENEATLIERSVFLQNTSGEHGGAIDQINGERMVLLDNVLLEGNSGESTIYTEDSLSLRNVSMIANEAGLATGDGAKLSAQNTIFADGAANFQADGDVDVTSLGGNLSNDNSLSGHLTNAGAHPDQHAANPLLDADRVPVMGSPCVDRGNPDGIDPMALDANGEMRIQGTNIDIGALESSFNFSSTSGLALDAGVGVFPNPFGAVLNIKSEERPTAARLFDPAGKLLAVLPAGETQLALGDELAPGSYFLEVEFEKGTVNKKVVKE